MSSVLVIWRSPSGDAQALPDRMYGLLDPAAAEISGAGFPPGIPVNLPPGIKVAGGAPHCVGHHMSAANVEEAWSALRRVGRQGIDKARRNGCRADAIDDHEYLRLATVKATALAGRPPHRGLLDALRSVYGPERVHLSGVRYGGEAIAAVLAVSVDSYVMLVDGASDRAHWDKNPNNLAVWEAVASRVADGCSHVDYGFSPVGAGDARFKDHMGGRAVYY